jgi:Dyp-type peroxidase family
MPINLNAALPSGKLSAEENAMLDDLQGNILKGHGREQTTNLFLRFTGPAAKAWVAGMATQVTKASDQLKQAKNFKEAKAAGKAPAAIPFISFYLTADGYRALGVPKNRQPKDAAFQVGMKARTGLNDPPVPAWDEKGPIHALLLVGLSEKELGKTVQSLLDALPPSVQLAAREDGLAYKNLNGDGIEHFGYVDGRSQPLMLKEDVERERYGSDGTSVWNPEFPLKQALVADPGAGKSKTSFGSYFVFRKLEQNVRDFKAKEAELGELLVKAAEAEAAKSAKSLSETEKDAIGERAGALIVGRFEDGTPVTLQNHEGMNHPVPNNFDYRDDDMGSKCPFHAHIRKSNPRGETAGGSAPALKEERSHIMARRGITYGVRKTAPEGIRSPIEFAEPEGQEPTGGVGLLFMAYMGDIAKQFEFTQISWVNNPSFIHPDAGTGPLTGTDPVIGQGPAGGQACPMTWGKLPDDTTFTKFDLRGFVKLLGGEYFFAPSLTGLKSIGK